MVSIIAATSLIALNRSVASPAFEVPVRAPSTPSCLNSRSNADSSIGSTVDRNDLESHAARVLDAEVAQPADSENGDQVPGARRRIPQRAECRQTGAQQRCGIDRREIIRHGDQAAGFGDHHLRVAAVLLDPCVALVYAVHEIAIAAVLAMPAAPAEEADADALAQLPPFDAFAGHIDPPDRLVARDPRPLNRQYPF